jgi:hypothetical protein
MKNRIAIAGSFIFACFLVSCDNNKPASESSPDSNTINLAVVGNERCDVHKIECKEEDIEMIVMHGPSYPEEYWQARRSEGYIQAAKLIFPNSKSFQPYAVPGSSYAKEEGGKMTRRFYCPECREAEKMWHADKHKNSAEQAIPSRRKVPF